MVRRFACTLLVAVCLTSIGAAQGLLERTRQATADHASSGVQVHGDGPWFNSAVDPMALLAAVVVVPTAPLWLPAGILDDHLFEPGYFPAQPYAAPHCHYIHPGEFLPQENDLPFYDPAFLKPWAVRLTVEDGNNVDGLNRLSGRFELDTAWRLGLETNWNYFHESIGTTHSDETVLGDINATWRFAQASWMQWHVGAGVNLLSDRHGTRGGFNFLYSTDVYPIDPVVLSAALNAGSIDNAFLFHARGTVGWQIDRFELFAGYDFRRIGRVNLQGPTAGVRLSF